MNIIVTGGAEVYRKQLYFSHVKKIPGLPHHLSGLSDLCRGNLSTLAPVMDNPIPTPFRKESITGREAVYKLFEEEHPDMVVNFAAESHVDHPIENPEVSLPQILSVLLFSWMHAANTVSNVIIRYLLMKFTEIFH